MVYRTIQGFRHRGLGFRILGSGLLIFGFRVEGLWGIRGHILCRGYIPLFNTSTWLGRPGQMILWG